MMRTLVAGLSLRVWAKRSRMGRICGLIAALPLSKEMSLGISSFSWLSAVRVTSTPVPAVAWAMAWRWASMRWDHT